ncbi:TolB family protein [Neosynechococcus sphagnicola]|uniref:TolB family protein n=1 Tax=Neosynechococcus sphagnicola TaxID=1501145 RepID=UPI0009DCB5D0|nr:TolB family protein [Neosynechococcus sphagnicola]
MKTTIQGILIRGGTAPHRSLPSHAKGFHARARQVALGLITSLGLTLVGCGSGSGPLGSMFLNSRYTDQQPALSGDGRFLAFVSSRNGTAQILFYDLQQRRFWDLPGLNRPDAIAESPSLSYTGRYLVYLSAAQGRPEIQLYDRITQRVQPLSVGYRGWMRHPSMSPDGRYIAFENSLRGQWDIEVFDRGPNIELDRPNDGRPQPSPVTVPP